MNVADREYARRQSHRLLANRRSPRVPKFIVNKDYDNSRTIVADQHQLKDGYFHFYDDNGEVATIKESQVQTIDRED